MSNQVYNKSDMKTSGTKIDEFINGLGPLLAFKTPFRLIPKLEILAAFKMGFSKEETDLRRRILASYIKGRYFAAKIDSDFTM